MNVQKHLNNCITLPKERLLGKSNKHINDLDNRE